MTVQECDALCESDSQKWEDLAEAALGALHADGKEEDDMTCLVCGNGIEEHPAYQESWRT